MKKKSIDCFRAALKAVTKENRKKHGNQYRAGLAIRAEVNLKTLNDIAMKRRVGSEDIRIRIAEALDYEYSTFLALGDKLLEDLTLQQAISYVKQHEPLRVNRDGVIEGILSDWDELSLQEREHLRDLSHAYRLKKWKHYNAMSDFGVHTEDRFFFIWRTVCQDNEVEVTFDENAFDLLSKYKQLLLSDWAILRAVEEYTSWK